MALLRKIVVNGKEYLWTYSFDDYDYQNDSSLVVKSADKKGKLIVYFKTDKWDHGYCPFNKGVQATLNNEPVTINLNQPRFAAEIIAFVLDKLQVDCLSGTVELDDGIQILHDLGYEFDYQKSWPFKETSIIISNGVAVIKSSEPIITDAQSALDQIATVQYYYNVNCIAISKEAIIEDFFKLSTGIAGEVLQKFSNYRAKLAIFGDFSGYESKPLHDFIYECNNGNTVFFVSTEEEAISRLSQNEQT